MSAGFDLLFFARLGLDAAGLAGIGLLALAALRLARRDQSWGGGLMAFGAIALLAARLAVIAMPHVLTGEVLAEMPAVAIRLAATLPTVLLTLGLAGVVWGLWGHSRWMQEGH